MKPENGAPDAWAIMNKVLANPNRIFWAFALKMSRITRGSSEKKDPDAIPNIITNVHTKAIEFARSRTNMPIISITSSKIIK